MNVRKAKESAEPGYPDHKEFLLNRHLLGAAVLGAGMVMGACNERTMGVPRPPTRLGGVAPRVTAHSHSIKLRVAGNHTVEPTKIERPNRLAGDVAMIPKPDEPRQDPPKKEDPPPPPGVPPPR
jgi:hypothetical protein